MENKNDHRLAIGVTWIISFLVMWIGFTIFLPTNEFQFHLEQIEQNVYSKDWDQAKRSMEELKRIYNTKRTLIQANNATEILTTFNFTMGQLDSSLKHEQDAALDYVGGLRSSLKFVMKSFSGP